MKVQVIDEDFNQNILLGGDWKLQLVRDGGEELVHLRFQIFLVTAGLDAEFPNPIALVINNLTAAL